MTFSTRDLLWLMVVVSPAVVLAINMFGFQAAKHKMDARHKLEIARLVSDVAELQMEVAGLVSRLKKLLGRQVVAGKGRPIEDWLPEDYEKLIKKMEAEREEIMRQLDSGKIRVIEVSELFGKEIVEVMDAKCVEIINGDTIKCLSNENEMFVVRFDSIACPKFDQPFGDKAKQRTSDLCLNRKVEILKTGEDSDGVVIGFVLVDETVMSAQLLKDGLAWHFRQTSDDQNLEAIEAKAKAAKHGLWANGKDAVPPWDWQ